MDKIDELITKFKTIKEELNKTGMNYAPGGQENPNGAASAPPMDNMGKEESKFKEVQHKIEGEGHSKESAARITAAIGRKEIGQKAMTARSVAARKSDDKEDVKLAEEIEDKVLAHMKRNAKDEKKEGHDLKIDKKEKHEGVVPVNPTTWAKKDGPENLRCSEAGQWKIEKDDDWTGAYTKRSRQIQNYKNQTNDALANQRAARKPFDYSNHVTPATPNSKIGEPNRPWTPQAPKIPGNTDG